MTSHLSILYEDRWLVVVDKPSGLPTQGTRAGEPGVFELLDRQRSYVALHHRLDRPASGLVLLGLSRQANPGLAAAFREHRIQRTYLAVLVGSLTADTTWAWPVEGKPARTQVRVLSTRSGFTAVELRLHTGRKHQLRRHAAMAGLPLAGDRRYGGEAGRAWPRLALHATRLELSHPVTGQALKVESPLPADLQGLWSLLG